MISLKNKLRLMALLPDYQLLSDAADASALLGCGAVEAASAAEVLAAAELGLGRRDIFFAAPNLDGAASVLDKCRLVAASMEELSAINDASAACGVITMVGLRLVADGFEGRGITTSQLRSMVHDIKQLKSVSVCGCIVTGNIEGLHGKELGKFIRSTYQTAKMMTVILPCSMPYICIADCLEVIARNETEHPEDFEEFLTAANIVGMQNRTAFYADYYIQ